MYRQKKNFFHNWNLPRSPLAVGMKLFAQCFLELMTCKGTCFTTDKLETGQEKKEVQADSEYAAAQI